jgi:CBS domain-containing protein
MEVHGTVNDILKTKGNEVWTTTPACTVFEALRLMGEKNIGALVALQDGKVVGVLSERDYSRKVVLRGRTSRDTLVGDILSFPAVTVEPGDPIEKCMQLMTGRRIRHLPVVKDGELAGLISIGDLVNWIIHVQRQTIQQLHGYIAGGGYPG